MEKIFAKRSFFFIFFSFTINEIENIFKFPGSTLASRYISIVKTNYELRMSNYEQPITK